MSIIVTGASGNLGRHVIEGLMEKVPAGQITAVVRSEEKAEGFAASGVKIAVAGELSNFLDMADDLLADPLRIIDGTISVRDLPGVGAEIDEEKLAAYRLS